MDYFIALYRTFIFYIIITVIYRFMGKREIGQLGIIDLIVSILIAELAAISIDNIHESMLLTILPIALLVAIQMSLSYISLKSSKVRDTFDGKVSIIISGGKINFKEMVRQRYNLEDLLTQLRFKDIKSIEDVDYAVLETSGKLSVFKKSDTRAGEYPMPLILDGVIDEITLKAIKKNKSWISEMLKDNEVTLKDVFYGFYTKNKLYIIRKESLKTT